MNTKLDLALLADVFAQDARVVLAVLFGSSKDGTVRAGRDVDIGVLLSPPLSPVAFFTFYTEMADRLPSIAELDLVDLNHAGSVLAFEALSGKRLFVRDLEAVAAYSSQVARQYESDMLHAGIHHAA